MSATPRRHRDKVRGDAGFPVRLFDFALDQVLTKYIWNIEMKGTPDKTVSRAKTAKNAKVDFDKKRVAWAGPLRAWRAWRDKVSCSRFVGYS
jgi:hypothetical protein